MTSVTGGDDGDGRDALVETIIQTLVATLVATLISKVMSSLWSKRRGIAPLNDPGLDDVAWSSAIAWSAGVGAAAGIAKLLARRETTKRFEQRAARRPANVV